MLGGSVPPTSTTPPPKSNRETSPISATRIAATVGPIPWRAAARRSGGCEVTVIANTALGRDDQVGYVLFAPIDLTEGAIHRDRRGVLGSTDQATG
jgi:hypothetical protein